MMFYFYITKVYLFSISIKSIYQDQRQIITMLAFSIFTKEMETVKKKSKIANGCIVSFIVETVFWGFGVGVR